MATRGALAHYGIWGALARYGCAVRGLRRIGPAICDHHAAYIDWAEYKRNQMLLTANAYGRVSEQKSLRATSSDHRAECSAQLTRRIVY